MGNKRQLLSVPEPEYVIQAVSTIEFRGEGGGHQNVTKTRLEGLWEGRGVSGRESFMNKGRDTGEDKAEQEIERLTHMG